ncbi:MAG: Rho termination factor N-terminal domain-containing protein [Chloroflexi bacterium]|nr:Rho termination factor N-terminal domain-containing protein [Chloroflexota bacterium]
MTTAHQNKIQWAKRVPRHQVRRLYESDARGMLDEALLEEVGHGMYARCADMFEVHEAREGRIKCRNCGTVILRHSRFWDKSEVLACERCGWQVTWGAYYDSYTGERLLPGAAEEVFRRFVDQWPTAHTAAAKMLLIDWLIHEFHMNQGIAGRPVGENVIHGSAQQVSELIEHLAYGSGSTAGLQDQPTWAAQLNDPIRLFRRSHAWADILSIARELGIEGRSRMREDELVAEMMRIAPERFVAPQGGRTSTTCST